MTILKLTPQNESFRSARNQACFCSGANVAQNIKKNENLAFVCTYVRIMTTALNPPKEKHGGLPKHFAQRAKLYGKIHTLTWRLTYICTWRPHLKTRQNEKFKYTQHKQTSIRSDQLCHTTTITMRLTCINHENMLVRRSPFLTDNRLT